jgi:hypothetical protein
MELKINLEDASLFPEWAKRSASNLWNVLLAVHEASHAVVSRHIGHGVEFVEVEINSATGNGQSLSLQPKTAPDIANFSILIGPDEGVDRFRQTYPGLAELTEREAGRMSQSDREELAQRVSEFARSWYWDGSVHPLAKDARAEASKILREHWAEVECIAARLLKNEKVTAAELNVRDFDLEVESRALELRKCRFYFPPDKPEAKPETQPTAPVKADPKREAATVERRYSWGRYTIKSDPGTRRAFRNAVEKSNLPAAKKRALLTPWNESRDQKLAGEIDAMLGGVKVDDPPINPKQAERDSLIQSLEVQREKHEAYKHVCDVRRELRHLGFQKDSDDLRIAELEALARARGVFETWKLRDFVSAHWHELSENRIYT